MGVHHHKLTVVPAEAAAAPLKDEAQVWIEQPPATFIDELRALLPKDTSWGAVEEFESTAEWGSDLRIWRNDERGGTVDAIEFRYAPIGDRIDLLRRFLDLVSRHGFLLVAQESGRVVAPQIEDVVGDLKTSTAFRFLSDPTGAIVESAKKVEG